MIASFSGAAEPPSPVISVVMPWKIFDGRLRIDQHGQLRLAQHVDEAGRDDLAGGVDGLSRGRAAASRPIAAIRPSRIADVAGVPGRPGAVDDVAVEDDDVEGVGLGA